MSSATWRLICTQCKSDYASSVRPMLRCSSCKDGWHTYCHSPVVTVAQYKAMYEAEKNRKAHPGAVRFSTWCCSRCSIANRHRSADQSIVVISSDEEENEPRPKRSVATSKSASPGATTPTEDVIDLTEGFSGLSPRKSKSRTRDTSPPRPHSQALDMLGWEEYRSPIASVRQQSQKRPSVTPTPPPGSATPSEPTIIIDDDDDPEMGVDADRGEPPRLATSKSPSPGSPRLTETRLLPQIIKEEMQEIVIPPPAEPEKPRRARKPKETKRFVPTSRKGKLRTNGFVNLHMPFGHETRPKVDLGTLEEALRRLGIEPNSG